MFKWEYIEKHAYRWRRRTWEKHLKKKEIVRGLFKQLISTSPTEMMIFHTYVHEGNIKIRTCDFDEFIQ